MSAASSCRCCACGQRPTTSSTSLDHQPRRRRSIQAQTAGSSPASHAPSRRRAAVPRALGGRGGNGGVPEDWLERIKQGIPEVEAPDYSSDSSPPPSPSGRPRAPGTTPLGARPRRGAGGSASSFSSVSSYSSDDEARASVRRQERVLLDAWTGVGGGGGEGNGGGGGGGNGNGAPAASVPLVGGASALLLLALLLAAGPPS